MLTRPLPAIIVNTLMILAAGVALAQEPAQPPSPSSAKPQPVMVTRMTKQLFDELTAYDTPYHVTERQTWKGVRVVGRAVADAKARFAWDTSGEQPVLVIRLTGEAQTRLSLDAGPAVGYAQATTPFDTSRRITFDGTRFIDGEVSSEARSRTTLQRVCSRRGGPIGRVVRRLAWRKLRTSQPEINQQVDRFTQDFVLERLDVEAKPHFYYDLGRVGILETALKEAFPEAKSFVYRLSADEEHLYVAWGPKDAEELDLPALAARCADYPLLLRVRMRPEQMLMAQALLLSDNPHQIVRAFMPEDISGVLEKGVRITVDGSWLEFSLPRPTIDKIVKALPR